MGQHLAETARHKSDLYDTSRDSHSSLPELESEWLEDNVSGLTSKLASFELVSFLFMIWSVPSFRCSRVLEVLHHQEVVGNEA